jgi:hypothetical protein
MTRVLVLVAATAIALSGCGGDDAVDEATPATPGEQRADDDRECGLTEVDGARAQVFCGDADASVTVGGSEHEFTGGQCEVGESWVVVNIGTLLLGDPTRMAEYDYFGLVAGDHPDAEAGASPATGEGTYDGGTLTFSAGGTGYLIVGTPSITFSDDLRRGEFSAQTNEGEEVSGTFSC